MGFNLVSLLLVQHLIICWQAGLSYLLCSNGLCLNGFVDLDPHTLREDLNVFPAESACIMQQGSSWGHTFLIELNLPNHNPSMFFWIPADESSCRAQSGQSTFLLLLIVSVPKKLSHPLVMLGVLLCFVYFGYPQKRKPAWFHSVTFLSQQRA